MVGHLNQAKYSVAMEWNGAMRIWRLNHDHVYVGPPGMKDTPEHEDDYETIEYIDLYEIPAWAYLLGAVWISGSKWLAERLYRLGLWPEFHIRPMLWFQNKLVLVKQQRIPRADFIALNQPPWDRSNLL